MKVQRGHELCRQGQPCYFVYFVIDGEFELSVSVNLVEKSSKDPDISKLIGP
jgi:CRP-like cAMP-binding protein